MERIRRAAHAGSWYTDNCEPLTSLVVLLLMSIGVLLEKFSFCGNFGFLRLFIETDRFLGGKTAF